ncbi:hypothetical protein CYMTET_13004 [Cymbomonas tetramitiformis]|uniref:beta-galactoside alpha-(2,6)-sialyltransferase n=1 Tax=Cymbomonas tetramitiformis TaxID=36881 RepID=A0AAE0GJG6_9CHLO|nr:hypothetical protein CYMTET_13004 [Cymbomonas tetramitiformis]
MDTSTVLTEEITSDLRQKIVDMVERRKEIESHTKRKTDVVNIELNGARAFQERVSSSSVAQRKATETSGEGVAEENTETLGEGVAEENTRVRRFNELKYSDQNGLDDSSASVEDDPSASVEDDSSASVEDDSSASVEDDSSALETESEFEGDDTEQPSRSPVSSLKTKRKPPPKFKGKSPATSRPRPASKPVAPAKPPVKAAAHMSRLAQARLSSGLPSSPGSVTTAQRPTASAAPRPKPGAPTAGGGLKKPAPRKVAPRVSKLSPVEDDAPEQSEEPEENSEMADSSTWLTNNKPGDEKILTLTKNLTRAIRPVQRPIPFWIQKHGGYSSIPTHPTKCGGKTCSKDEVCRQGGCQCPILRKGLECKVSKPAPTPCIGMMDFSPMVNIPPDLSALADWSTCAVVGGSATLQKQLKGAEIDRHSAVFRFNDAPVQGFERMVGSKTTIRIHNRVISNCPMEGGPGRERQLCFFYSQENQPISAERRCMARIKYGTCREVHPNYRLLRYVHSYWRKHPAPVNENTGKNFSTPASKISAGFFGVLLSLNLCGKVNVYGFNGKGDHYYPKSRQMAKTFKEQHSWAAEKACLLRVQRIYTGIVHFV